MLGDAAVERLPVSSIIPFSVFEPPLDLRQEQRQRQTSHKICGAGEGRECLSSHNHQCRSIPWLLLGLLIKTVDVC